MEELDGEPTVTVRGPQRVLLALAAQGSGQLVTAGSSAPRPPRSLGAVAAAGGPVRAEPGRGAPRALRVRPAVPSACLPGPGPRCPSPPSSSRPSWWAKARMGAPGPGGAMGAFSLPNVASPCAVLAQGFLHVSSRETFCLNGCPCGLSVYQSSEECATCGWLAVTFMKKLVFFKCELPTVSPAWKALFLSPCFSNTSSSLCLRKAFRDLPG